MIHSRMFVILAAGLSCQSAGCRAVYATRPVEVVVTRTDTGQPAADVPVKIYYLSMLVTNPPKTVEGTTDATGRVTLPMADFQSGPYLQAGSTNFWVATDVVRYGGLLAYKATAHPEEPIPNYKVRLVPARQAFVPHRFRGLLGFRRTVTVTEVEREVDRALPLGSSRRDIEAWLTGQGIGFSYSDQPATHSQVAERDAEASSYQGVVVSIIRDTDRSLFVTGNIQLYFLLDADGRLARRLVEWVGTGP